MDKVKEYNCKDAFAAYCGVEIVEIGDGTAKGRLSLKPHHLNGVGIVHGAAIFTLADAVFAAASNSHGQRRCDKYKYISYLKQVNRVLLLRRWKQCPWTHRQLYDYDFR